MKLKRIYLLIFLKLCFDSSQGNTEEMRYILDTKKSSVRYAFESSLLAAKGSFTDYAGIFQYDTIHPSKSSLTITANPKSATYDSLPIDKMFLIQGLIQTLPTKEVRFQSTSFSPQTKDSFLISGDLFTGSGKSKETVSIPITLHTSRGTPVIIGKYSRVGFIGKKDKNPLTALVGEATCEAQFSFVFK